MPQDWRASPRRALLLFAGNSALVGVPENFCVLAGVGLDRVQNMDVVLFVHAYDVCLHDFAALVINFEPMRTRLSQHGDRPNSNGGGENRPFVDPMVFRELVRKFIDGGVRNADCGSLDWGYLYGVICVAEEK